MLSVKIRSHAGNAAMSAPFLSAVVVSFFFILGISIVVPVLPLVVETYGVTRAGSGLLLSSFALGRLAFDLIAGMLGDRFGIRRVALVACLITIIASAVAATTPAYPVLLASRVFQGIGSALYMTVAMSHVIALAPEGHVGRMMAIYQGVILAGVTFGPTVGGLVSEVWGIAGPFGLYAAFGVVGALVALRYMPRSLPEPHAGHDGAVLARGPQIRRLVRDPTFLLVLLAAFTVFAVRSGMGSTLMSLFAAERFGFSQTAIGLLLTASAAGNLAVLVFAGRSVDNAGRRRTLRIGLWATVPVAVGFAVAVSPWMLFVFAAGLGMAKGFASVVPAAVVSDLATPEIRGTAVGIPRMMADLGLLAGPFLTGLMADHLGFSTAFLVTGGFVVLVALAAGFMRETSPARAA
jgi:MFS family permease